MNSNEILRETRLLWLGPTTTSLSTDDTNVLNHVSKVMLSEVVPPLLDISEEFLIEEDEIQLVSGQRKVRIPHRAYGSQVRSVFHRDSTTGEPRKLDSVPRDHEIPFRSGSQPSSYYLSGDYVCVNGDVGYLQIAYPFQPSELTIADNLRGITAIDSSIPGQTTLTLSSNPPSNWSSSIFRFDIQGFRSGNEMKYWDLSITNIAGNQITVSSELAGATFGRHPVEVRDIVSIAGTAGFPFLPECLHSVLCVGAAARIASTMTDGEAYVNLKREFASQLEKQIKTLDRRIETVQPLINYKSRFRRSHWRSCGY